MDTVVSIGKQGSKISFQAKVKVNATFQELRAHNELHSLSVQASQDQQNDSPVALKNDARATIGRLQRGLGEKPLQMERRKLETPVICRQLINTNVDGSLYSIHV